MIDILPLYLDTKLDDIRNGLIALFVLSILFFLDIKDEKYTGRWCTLLVVVIIFGLLLIITPTSEQVKEMRTSIKLECLN